MPSLARAQVHTFSLPSADAVRAIPEFARQAGVQIVAPADQLVGLKTPAISGQLEVRAALAQLIAGTGLSVAEDDGRMIILRRIEIVPPAPPSQLQRLVVSVDKRDELAVKAPVSLSAFGGDAAERAGVADVPSLQTVVPGLEFPRYFNGTTPTLRGIGSTTGVGDVEPAVAIYVDDVYLASPSAAVLQLNSVDHIEVLKGPQGTLFGRNATGGVIQIFTRTPSPEAGGEVKLGYGAYSTGEGGLYLTGGLAPGLAADLALSALDQASGWGRNLFTGQDAFKEWSYSGRSKWIYEAGGGVRLTAALDYARDRYSSGVAMRPVPGAIFLDGSGYQGFYNVSEAPTGYTDNRQGGGSLKVEAPIGDLRLVSVTAARRTDARVHADEDQTPLPLQDFVYTDARDTFTQELRLLSPDDTKFRWITGLFYLNDLSGIDPLQATGSAFPPSGVMTERLRQRTQSTAAFGDMTIEAGPRTHITAGLRYTYDLKSFDGSQTGGDGVGTSTMRISHDTATTYKLVLSRDLGADVAAYASYSRGFKGGAYNLFDFTSPPVKPEFVDAYEIGAKAELFDRRLRLSGAAYYYDFRNQQVSTLVQNGDATSAILQNAARSTNLGLDLDAELVPTQGLSLRAAISAMHSVFSDFPQATLSKPAPGGGNVTFSGDASGNRTPHSPDLTAALSGDYAWRTPSGQIDVAMAYKFNGGFFWDADNRLRQSPYHLLNGSIAWSPRGGWTVELWGKNLLWARYSVYTTANIVGDEESPAPPRTYGVMLKRRF